MEITLGADRPVVSSAEDDMTEPIDPSTTLLDLRASIDNIDAALTYLLAEWFRCTKQVGRLKAEHGMPASDPSREENQIARLKRLAEDADLDPAFAEKWFNFVVAEVIQHHRVAAEGVESGAE
jgi:chorismate mutase